MANQADPTQILNQRNAEVAQIRQYADLTEDAKSRRIDEVNARYQAEYAEAKEAQKRRIEGEVLSSRKGVYGVPTEGAISTGEVAQVHEAFRSAWNDVQIATLNPMDAQEELEQILTQAERTGDALLGRAAYHRGLDLGLQPIVDRYLVDKPKEAKALERYNKALQEQNQLQSFEGLFAQAITDKAFAS